MNKRAVIIFNLGGPDSLASVEPFLFNLFSDHDIFRIPVGQKVFARIISRRRAPKTKRIYEQIDGKSPLNYWTEYQRQMLQKALKKELAEIEVFTAMRYWHPIIKDVAEQIAMHNFDRIVLLPLYPHYSAATTGSSFNEWKRVYKGDPTRLIYVNDYFDNPHYISAINNRIDESILDFPEKIRSDIQLLFSAHGTPLRLVKRGDPYSDQIKKTVADVMAARNFSHEHHLCFQSKVGPLKWLKPSTAEMIEHLGARNKKHLLVIPVSFVSDHVETLYELEIEYRRIAENLNIENYRVMKGLNDSETFIEALKKITLKAMEEDRASIRGKG
ncbi:MAG TPA: ferrochelatase [Desulfobacterales bacterium]|nr:ferrochelatase [Desulfobacterales bacterium]